MNDSSSLELTQDCPATQIPAGNTVVLPAGTPLEVVQNLGGALTVRALGGLFRIAPDQAGALGGKPATPTPAGTASSDQLSEEMVWDTLKTCYDPEIPVNIVDLGLVYDMQIEPLPSGKKRVAVKMTLTAPGCGMGGAIAGDAQQRLLDLPEVQEAAVEIVWDPPWHHARITPVGRKALGLDEENQG